MLGKHVFVVILYTENLPASIPSLFILFLFSFIPFLMRLEGCKSWASHWFVGRAVAAARFWNFRC
jgi:hypothetical protein